jgi:hypothetical protein
MDVAAASGDKSRLDPRLDFAVESSVISALPKDMSWAGPEEASASARFSRSNLPLWKSPAPGCAARVDSTVVAACASCIHAIVCPPLRGFGLVLT